MIYATWYRYYFLADSNGEGKGGQTRAVCLFPAGVMPPASQKDAAAATLALKPGTEAAEIRGHAPHGS